MQSSSGMYKLIEIIELKNVIEGMVYKNVMDIKLRSENIPLLWKKFFLKVSNERNNQYNRPKFLQNFREKHFYNFNER